MAQKILLRRGLKLNLPILSAGEFGFCTDTRELFVGTGSTNVQVIHEDIMGLLANLTTGTKSSIVSAINELNQSLQSKSNVGHKHLTSDISDFDVTNKANGYVLTYDSTSDKFILKALPAGTGGGATNLDALTDVDLTTPPSTGDFLKFQNGMWKPGSMSGMTLQDFTKETVKLSIPSMVRSVEILDTTKTSISLKWGTSRTPNISAYIIYLNGVQIGSTAQTTFSITGLLSATTYDVRITARTADNKESKPYILSIKTLGNYAYSFATGQYLSLPTVTLTSIEMTIQFVTKKASWDNTMVTSLTTLNSYSLSAQNNGTQWKRLGFPLMYVNGVVTTDMNYATIPENQKVTVRIDTAPDDILTDSLNLLATKTNLTGMTGTLYRVKIYRLSDDGKRVLYHDYDLSYQATTSIPDSLGNGPDMIMHGGTFISN